MLKLYLKKIGHRAFEECFDLWQIPESVEEINERCFDKKFLLRTSGFKSGNCFVDYLSSGSLEEILNSQPGLTTPQMRYCDAQRFCSLIRRDLKFQFGSTF